MFKRLKSKILYHPVLVVVSFLGLAVIMLNANPFKGETVAPMDLLTAKAGWASLNLDIQSIHPERTDIIDARLPSWIYIKHQVRNGRIPLWSPTRAGGSPGAQLFSRSAFSPAFFFFCLFKDDALGYYVSHIVNILIGLCGIYLFLNLFVDSFAAYFGSVVYTFCGFNAAWFFWAQFATSIWIPWLLYFGYHSLQTMQVRYLVALTLANVMLISGGFPTIAIFGYMALGMLMLSFYWKASRPLKLIPVEIVLVGFFLMVSFLITAPMVYPLKEMLNFTGRMLERSGGTNYSLTDLALFVKPYASNLPIVEKTLYVGLAPLGLSAISLFWVRRKFLALYGLLLFAISITIAFSLIHPDLIRQIPTFNSNPWNRMTILAGLALACLSAIGLASIGKRIRVKALYYVLAVLLIGGQVIDLKILFNSFNSSVPGASFYARTPSITYIQKNIAPLQYVIADNNFQTSGTLSAYGINEWFSHNFRSKRERDLLSQLVTNPFRTPTMASFPSYQIVFNQPLMDEMNVRYVLSSNGTIRKQTRIFRGEEVSKPLSPLPKNDLGLSMSLEKTILFNTIELLMGTFHAPHAPADVILDLYSGVDDAGRLIERVVTPKENVVDNRWAAFHFKNTRQLDPGNYYLKLSLSNDRVAGKLTAWAYATKDMADETLMKNESAHVYVNGHRRPYQLNMIFYQNVAIGPNWVPHQFEKGITVYENKNVAGSAYWMPNLSPEAAINYAPVRILEYESDRMTLEYRGDSKGWVVIPMRNYPGWRAYVDGIRQSYSIFSSIMPAIPVTGHNKIIFKYEPSHFKKLLALSMGSLSLVLILFTFFRRKTLVRR
jgi:hypothetical protein